MNSGAVSSVLLTPPISPHRNASKLTPEEEKPAEDETQMNALSLKTLLDLHDWRCGCPTQKKEPCKRRIPEKNKDQVNSQIESMIALTRSSLDLGAELDKLVLLVHCSQHDCGNPKDSRIDAWTAAFPVKDGVVSVEKQIRKALGRISAQCIGMTLKGKRCGWKIGGQKVQTCTKTVDEIVKPEVYMDDTQLDRLLEVLNANIHCHGHINKRSLDTTRWKLSIMEIRKQVDSESVKSIKSNAPESIESQTRSPTTQDTGSLPSKMSNLIIQNRPLPTPRPCQS